jgi:hypothetical protein
MKLSIQRVVSAVSEFAQVLGHWTSCLIQRAFCLSTTLLSAVVAQLRALWLWTLRRRYLLLPLLALMLCSQPFGFILTLLPPDWIHSRLTLSTEANDLMNRLALTWFLLALLLETALPAPDARQFLYRNMFSLLGALGSSLIVWSVPQVHTLFRLPAIASLSATPDELLTIGFLAFMVFLLLFHLGLASQLNLRTLLYPATAQYHTDAPSAASVRIDQPTTLLGHGNLRRLPDVLMRVISRMPYLVPLSAGVWMLLLVMSDPNGTYWDRARVSWTGGLLLTLTGLWTLSLLCRSSTAFVSVGQVIVGRFIWLIFLCLAVSELLWFSCVGLPFLSPRNYTIWAIICGSSD